MQYHQKVFEPETYYRFNAGRTHLAETIPQLRNLVIDKGPLALLAL